VKGALICIASLVLVPLAGAPQQAQPLRAPLTEQATKALQTQVMLARAGYSPGEIDATTGSNTQSALAAFQQNGGNPGALPEDALTHYRITEQDAAGPYVPDIPSDLAQQAQLPALGYRDITEMLGERFHASPSLLRRLNQDAHFAAGDDILVPDIPNGVDPTRPPDDPSSQAAAPAQSGEPGVIITVSRGQSAVVVTDQNKRVLFFAPVTTGSEHDPLPIGHWKVTGIQHNPQFHYNPDLFWDATDNSKAIIKPGPNNPVGVVWIDIDRPHYGLHGTPEPSTVGKTASHGCVRLTNWDALVVASFARPGTSVIFAE